MSAKKSWDVVPNQAPKRAPRPAPAAPPRRSASVPVDMRPATRGPRPTPAPVRAPRLASQRPSGERLKDRRKKERKAWRITFAVVLLVIIAAVLYALWLPSLRVTTVRASDVDQRLIPTAEAALTGSYMHLIPRDSIFFFPKQEMRTALIEANPEVAAVSISRSSFNSITIAATPRSKAFLWCGTDIDNPYPAGCFDADAEGLLFKQSDLVAGTASTTEVAPGELRIFSPLDQAVAEGESPVRRHAMSASSIPDALRFVKAIRGMGAPVSALALRGDEADLWLNGPTRITYVLGHEQEASELAASTLSKLPLTDGTIQYVDLRFTGKVYVKRFGE